MANYPTSVSTNSNLYIAVNGLQTTLASTITNSVTTIPLTSTTGFPTTGYVTIENNEVVSYTGISGSNLTGCTRGADGTTALAHNTGVTVGATIVAAHHNLLKDEVIAIETALGANLSNVFPATPTTGTGNVVLQTSPTINSPTLTTPALGTPASGVLTNATGLPLTTGVTGVLPDGNTTATPNATASTIVERDANKNTKVNNIVENFTTTVTAAGTTTLTASSSPLQQFTGTTTQTVTLPDCTTLSTGYQITVINRSTGAVAVNNNGGSLQQSVGANSVAVFTCTNTGSANGTWDVNAAASGGITQLTGDVTAGPGSGSQAATVASVGGKSAGFIADGAQNTLNFLINGGFEIWQRNTTFSSPATATYTADRWAMAYGGSGTFTVSRDTGVDTTGGNNIRSTYCLKFVVTTPNTMDSCRVLQTIENLDGFGSASVTVTAKVKTSVAGKINVIILGGAQSGASAYHSGSGNWETLTATIATVNSGTNLRVVIGFNDFAPTATTFYIDNAMMGYGTTGLTFVAPQPEVELARCQRYYEIGYAPGTVPGSNVGSAAAVTAVQTSTNRTISNYWLYKVPKRVNPTIRTWQLNGTASNIDWIDTGGTSHQVATDISVADTHGLNLRQTTSFTYVYANFGFDADAEF